MALKFFKIYITCISIQMCYLNITSKTCWINNYHSYHFVLISGPDLLLSDPWCFGLHGNDVDNGDDGVRRRSDDLRQSPQDLLRCPLRGEAQRQIQLPLQRVCRWRRNHCPTDKVIENFDVLFKLFSFYHNRLSNPYKCIWLFILKSIEILVEVRYWVNNWWKCGI